MLLAEILHESVSRLAHGHMHSVQRVDLAGCAGPGAQRLLRVANHGLPHAMLALQAVSDVVAELMLSEPTSGALRVFLRQARSFCRSSLACLACVGALLSLTTLLLGGSQPAVLLVSLPLEGGNAIRALVPFELQFLLRLLAGSALVDERWRRIFAITVRPIPVAFGWSWRAEFGAQCCPLMTRFANLALRSS